MAAPRGGRDPVVTSLNDGGPGSLRDAIASAQPGDTISFAVSGTIVLTNGELLIGKDLNIVGPGATSLAISAGGLSRILEIAPEMTVRLSGVTICDGHAADGNWGTSNSPAGGDGADGGGIYNAGSLTVAQCVVSNCAAGDGGWGFAAPNGTNWLGGVGGRGGAVYNAGGLWVVDSTFNSNSSGDGGGGGGNIADGGSGNAAGGGGAIFNGGRMALTSSVLDHNSAGRGGEGYAFPDYFVEVTNAQQHGGAGGDGGAVYDAGHGPTFVDGCQFSFNASGAGGYGGRTEMTGADVGGLGGAGGSGGAIWAGSSIRIHNCAFTSNQAGAGGAGGTGMNTGGAGAAGGSGGAVWAAKPARITGCTFLSNQAGAGAPGGGGSQGGGAGGNAGMGGAICGLDSVTLAGCLCVSNRTVRGGDGGDTSGQGRAAGSGGSGGSIYAGGMLRLNACAFTGNATGFGGRGSDVSTGRYYWSASGNGGAGGSGGAVCGESDLTAVQCTFNANKTGGGGMPGYFSSGAFSGIPSTDGSSGGQGGAIFGAGRLTLRECTVSGNVGGDGTAADTSIYSYNAGGVNAGAMISEGTAGATAAPRIHIYSKVGGPGGAGGTGGVYSGGGLNLVLCTIAGNAGGSGGAGGQSEAYYTYQPGGGGGGGGAGGVCCADELAVVACSIAENTGGSGGRGGYGSGDPFGPRSGQGTGGEGGAGGIFSTSTNSAACTVINTIVAANKGGVGGAGGPFFPYVFNDGAPDVQGAFASLGFNLIGACDGSFGFTNGVNGDFVGTTNAPVDAVLGPLADNGGPTLTMALLHGSPALDAGDDALLQKPYNLKTDQRGFARRSGQHVDIGAFEYQFGNGGGTTRPPVVLGALVGNGNARANVAGDAGAAAGFQLSFSNNAPGATFTVLASSNVSAPVEKWSVVGQAVPVGGGLFQFTDAGATNGAQRFYRVSAP